MTDTLQKRMYSFVPYNISEIQKGIQAGHAVEQYARIHGKSAYYKDYVDQHKTWIILSGGPTNNNYDIEEAGHLGNILNEVKKIGIPYAEFHEPDLNDALSAVCFLVDERVFNYDDYPEIPEFSKDKMQRTYGNSKWLELFKNGPVSLELISEEIPEIYKEWEKMLGGNDNIQLRYLLKGKKLA